VAEEGEEIIAVSLGYRFGLSELSYQASRKIAVDTSGMGLIIRAEQLKRALADGIRDHCLGPGGQDEKTRFANYDPGLETVAVVRTLRGRVAARRINTPEEG
jgi:CelD/BcsL family acetyltransferase involved in cellulose biosynthesis